MYCPITGIHLPKLLISAVFAFAFIFGYDYVVHSILLMPLYLETADIWRSPEDMETYFQWVVGGQFLYALLAGMFYALFARTTCLFKGIKFGLFVGLILGVNMMATYAYSPIPLNLALYWLAAATVQGMFLGVIYWVFYRDAGKAKGSGCHKNVCSTEDSADKQSKADDS